ncbi:MAG: hypothetical protein WBZ36_30720 [Candidatus Nitrosopolaris sp.]
MDVRRYICVGVKFRNVYSWVFCIESEISTLDLETTRTIADIRKDGLDKETLERIAADRAEMQRVKEEQKERLPGQFVSLKQDKETRIFLFTGQYQKVEKPATDFLTKQTIPGRMVTRFRFQVYDVTDSDNPSEVAIFERGNPEAEKILYWLARQQPQLTIMRNGAAGSQKTTYDIYPAK